MMNWRSKKWNMDMREYQQRSRMRNGKFYLIYVILLVAQIVLSGLLDFTQLFTPALLPAMILCVPLAVGTPVTLVIAFVSGFLVDFFSGGVLGLTCTALLPAALMKNIFLRICFDNDTYSRMNDLSVKKLGLGRILSCAFMMTALFMVIYVNWCAHLYYIRVCHQN